MVLMATTFGRYMVPGKFSALRRMLTPRRYLSRDYMAQHAGTIYGGAMVGRPELAVELARLGRAPSVLGYAQQLGAIWQLNALPWLADVRCPTLVLAGDDDPIVRPVNAQMLATRLPAARLHVIPRGGHMFMSTHAALTGRLIREFLDE